VRVLLDTHVALWALVDDPRLSSSARGLIEDSRNILFVSAATVWEIRIKRTVSPEKCPFREWRPFDFFNVPATGFSISPRIMPQGWKPSLVTTTIPSTASLWPKP